MVIEWSFMLKRALLLCVCLFSFTYGENVENVVKNFKAGPMVKKGKIYDLDKKSILQISYNVEKDDFYYLSAYLCRPKDSVMSVYINNLNIKDGNFIASSNGWQSCQLLKDDDGTAKPVYLKRGINEFYFTNNSIELPLIDELKISQVSNLSKINMVEFEDWLTAIKNTKREMLQTSSKSDFENNAVAMAAAEWEPGQNQDPLYQYNGYVNQQLSYTFMTEVYLSANVSTVFETSNPSAGADPVMYLIDDDNPGLLSLVDDDGAGALQSKITVTAPASGWYRLILRSYSVNSTGTVDIRKNGSLFISGAPIAGKMYYCNTSTNTYVHQYFTCEPYLKDYQDTYMFVSSSYKSPIIGFNDDFSCSSIYGDYDWRYMSRIFVDKQIITYAMVACYNPSSINNICDIYLGNREIKLTNFYLLKKYDQIKSAESSMYYNCIAYSGGITNENFWPPLQSMAGPYYDPDPLTAFDNYYANRSGYTQEKVLRHAGAIDFTRNGANYQNSLIDLWGRNYSTGVDYTHASVKKYADQNMHGFDWESKPGPNHRIFHIRHGLNGGSYGEVLLHYKQNSTTEIRSIESSPQVMDANEALSLNLEVTDSNVLFTTEEEEKIAFYNKKIKTKLKEKIVNSFNNLVRLIEFDSIISFQSNPLFIKEHSIYKELLSVCSTNKNKIVPLIFNLMKSDNSYLYLLLFDDLILKDNIEKYEELIAEYTLNQFDDQGRHILYSHKNIMMKLAKSVLAEKY